MSQLSPYLSSCLWVYPLINEKTTPEQFSLSWVLRMVQFFKHCHKPYYAQMVESPDSRLRSQEARRWLFKHHRSFHCIILAAGSALLNQTIKLSPIAAKH
jgi:hypothetical protein